LLYIAALVAGALKLELLTGVCAMSTASSLIQIHLPWMG
jgi:hypothetical protein